LAKDEKEYWSKSGSELIRILEQRLTEMAFLVESIKKSLERIEGTQ